MTIQQCKYVLKIAKVGSFSEAAKQLFIAQPSLSGSVKSLEQELGIEIFRRSAGGVCLTDDGAEFVRYASKIAEYEDFISKRYNEEKECHKLFVVTQHYDFVADVFAKMVRDVKEEYYKFSLREIKTHDVIKEIETAYSDIGIIAIKDSDFGIMKRYLDKKGLVFNAFIKASPHVFLRNGHPLSKNKCLSYGDLIDYPYVSYEQGSHNISYFAEEITTEPDSDKHIEISDRASLMNMLLVTDCYTTGTGIMPSALNNGSIASIPLSCDDFFVIGYILRADRKISALMQKFIDLLTESVKDM